MQTFAELVRMTHSVSPASPVREGESMPGSASGELEADAASPERSRFSRLLASFGLGEGTIPLLRPLKTPRGGGGR
jgi:hypothetical protein